MQQSSKAAGVFVRGAGNRFGAWASWLLILGLLWSTMASAVGLPSTYPGCATRNVTVPWGGSVNVDLTACHFFGLGVVSTPPTHGTATEGDVAPVDTYNYNHNGSTPAGGGSDQFVVLDDNSDFITVNVTISAPTSAITVSPSALPVMTAGTPFSQTLTSSGGTGPYTYTLESGTLPVGLSLTSGGVLSGTPTQRGGYGFSVRSQDSLGDFAVKAYGDSVAAPTLAITPASATAIQGIAFSQTLSVTGGVAPHSFLLESGSFPAGISVSSAGVVSGTTAAAPGAYPVTLRVTDSSTGPGSYFELETFTLTVSPPPSVSIAVAPASVSEDGATNLVYTVTRDLNLSSSTVVNLTTSGTATSGVDYTGGVATATIPAGATTTTVTIDPTVDGTVEADETVILTVAAGTGYTAGAPAAATGTILNDDVPSVSIAVAPASVAEDGATNLVYTVTLDQAAFVPLSVNFTGAGTATSGVDYAAVASPLAIPAGNTTGTITVNPTADATIESDETVQITLAAGTGYVVGAPASATGTILNDDLPTLAINDVTLAEGNAGTINATFTVSLSAPAGPGGVTFDIATANGAATGGVDYVSNSLTGQTIPAGNSTYSFTVLVNGDALNEPSETFFVNVTNVVNAVVADGQGVGTIVNDDPLPSLAINDATVVEGNAGTVNAVFTVTLSAASGQTVAVNYATADGTAAAPGDYTSTAGTLTFTPGQVSQTITVLVSGDTTPEANETFTVGLSGATNATIADATGAGTITNDDVPVTVAPATLPAADVAAAYSQTITASGGAAPYSFAVTAGALPAGLSLSAGGTLSGTPTAGGSFNFTVTATDSSGAPGPYSGSRAYTLVVNAPTIAISPATLPDGNQDQAYSQAITASGGTAPYSYAVTAGALPAGLTLSAGGGLSGTPTVFGSFNFTVTATDSSTGTGPYTGGRAYTLAVAELPPVAGAVALTVAYDSGANPVTLNVSGGVPTSVAIGTAASNGTAIASGTAITYQPNTGYAGPDSFTYTATNASGTSAPATVTVTVNDPVITITPSGGFAATVGAPYTQTFTWNGGAQPWSGFQVTNLPAGVAITGTTADSVTISGTPTQAGSFTLNASATDSSTGNGPYTVGQAFVLTVAPPTLALTPAAGTLAAPYAVAYSQAFTPSGGTGPYSFVLGGSLPTGLSFSAATGTLSGTPTAPGSYPITVSAVDQGSTGTGSPFMISQSYTIDVPAPVVVVDPATLPDADAGVAYSQSLTASGGAAPYAFSITAGGLPAGLNLSAGGVLSGTPTEVGSFPVTVTATDTNGQTGSRAYTLVVAAPTLAMTPAPGVLAVPYGAPYSQAFPATGGTGTFSYVLTGTLPAGLSFAGNTVSGTATVPGSYPITVTATDTTLTGTGAPFSIAQNYTLDVAAPAIAIDPATLPNTTAGMAYGETLTASGGVAPYSFAVTAGGLPPGTTLTAGGTLSGAPTDSGSFGFTVTATDTHGQTGSRAYTVAVLVPTLAIAPATLPAGVAGSAYSQAIVASGGIAPYSYAVTAGALPAGLSLSGTGTLAGTPTVAGSFNLTITATDSTGGTAATVGQAYTLVIDAPTLTITPTTLPGGTVGTAYAATLSTSGGTAPYAYAVTAGTLPAGLSLAADGSLAGTPTLAGTSNITVTSTDALGFTATQAYAIVIVDAVPVAADDAATVLAGESVTIPVTDNDTGIITSVAIATAPVDGTAVVNGLDVVYTAAPGAPGDESFTYTITGPGGTSAPATVNVTVNPVPGAVSRQVSTLPATPVQVNLSTDATGGPFTSADIVALTPAGSGTATIADTPAGYVLTFTPAADFTGLATVQFTLSNAYATSDVATIEISVEPRPDPSQDAEVRGLIDAQAESARRFAQAQIGNFQQRLERLHGAGSEGGVQNGVSFSVGPACPEQVLLSIVGDRCGPQPETGTAGYGNGATGGNGSQGGGGNAPFSIWTGGVIRSGAQDGRNGTANIDFETDGLSVGADYRLSDRFVFGGGFGYGTDQNDIGENGSRVKGKAVSAALYASWQPGGRFFLDGLLGYQRLSYDLRRYLTGAGGFVYGDRDGNQWFASLSAGADIVRDNLQFTPYARVDVAQASLDSYTETGHPILSLAYGEMDVDTLTGNLGLRLDFHHRMNWGVFSPQLRVEYQHEFQDNGSGTIQYADLLSGPVYRTDVTGFDRNRFLIGLGMMFLTDEDLSVRLEYRGLVGSDDRDNGLMLNIEKSY